MPPKKRQAEDGLDEEDDNKKIVKTEESNSAGTNTSDAGSGNSDDAAGQQKSDNGGKAEQPGPSDDTSDNYVDDEASAVDSSSDKLEKKKFRVEGSKVVGTLLYCGGTNWDLIGRKELPKTAKNAVGHNLYGPHTLAGLKGIRVKSVISGSVACHTVIITDQGKAMTWGRNDKGQLGSCDIKRRDNPALVEILKEHNIVSAACGRSHTLFLTDRGICYACGDNKMGQCGIGSQNPAINIPTRIAFKGRPLKLLACGAEFSMIVDVKGSLFSFGCPEYGQLGHNSDGRYFVTSNKLSFRCEVAPRRVAAFIEKTRDGHISIVDDVSVVGIACGINHTVVLDTKKRCLSWGFGGYGRLGHAEQKDEFVPRLIKSFDGPNRGVKSVYAGGTYSMAINEYGLLFFWGQHKRTGEAFMYPKPVQDLAGWQIHGVGCANTSIVVLADESVIAWGPSPTYGELGYGENRPKSSTTPQEVKPLDGVHILSVSCGYGHTLFIAKDDTDDDRAKINKLPEFTP